MMKTFIKAAGAASVLAVAVASVNATADPLDQLYFKQAAGWDADNFNFTEGALEPVPNPIVGEPDGLFNPTGADAPANTYETIAWQGDNQPAQSSIDIESFTSSSTTIRLDENFAADLDGEWNAGDWWVIDTLTQTNEVLSLIDGGGNLPNPLWIADTLANLRIYSDSVDGTLAFADLNSKTTIEFWETLNTDTCAASPNPLGTLCDDIFRIAAIELAPVTFALDGYFYTLDFTLLPGDSKDAQGNVLGQTLICPDPTNALCDNVNVTEGQIWVFTPETNPGTSELHVAMSFSVVPVPEPSALALFGIGMLGLGFAARRRKSA